VGVSVFAREPPAPCLAFKVGQPPASDLGSGQRVLVKGGKLDTRLQYHRVPADHWEIMTAQAGFLDGFTRAAVFSSHFRVFHLGEGESAFALKGGHRPSTFLQRACRALG